MIHISSHTTPTSRLKVAYDGGYDVVRAVTKVPWPYRWGLDLAFRYQYVYRHREAWRRKSASSAEVVKALRIDYIMRQMRGRCEETVYTHLQELG